MTKIKATDDASEFQVIKDIAFIELDPEKYKNDIIINIQSDDLFSFGAYGGLSNDNYFYYSIAYKPSLNIFGVKSYEFTIKYQAQNEAPEKNEKYYFSIMFEKSTANQKIIISMLMH